MITRLALRNFKSISTDEPIALGKFSVFCGANSSGKSSLIQAVLMLAQTFSSRYDFDTVVLNGHLVRLGALTDILSHKSDGSPIHVSFQINNSRVRSYDSRLRSIEYECVFGSARNTRAHSEDDYHPAILSIRLRINHVINGAEQTDVLDCARQEIPAGGENSLDTGTLFNVRHIESGELTALAKDYPDFKIIGCESNAFIPYSFRIEYNHAKKIGPHFVALITGKGSPRQLSLRLDKGDEMDTIIPAPFFETLNRCISEERAEMIRSLRVPDELRRMIKDVAKTRRTTVEAIWKEIVSKNALSVDLLDSSYTQGQVTVGLWLKHLDGLDEAKRKALTELMDKRRADLQVAWDINSPPDVRATVISLQSFHHVATYLAAYFSRSLKYLGPLRHEPQAVYSSLGHSDPRNVGLKGEFTAAVLHINRWKTISYPSPKPNSEHHFSYETKTTSLQVACKEWLSYLGVISDYDTRDKGKLGYEIYVKIDAHDRWQDLTHVGVGVSQVLPIVLMFLLSDPDDVLIFEQPELHLHPKVQSRLCDFFCAMAATGRQSVIETHSEYLINRLRLRIAQSRDNELRDMSSVFFITKKDSRSDFSKVEINEFGAILDWPQDFFDQTDKETENILIEASKKKRLSLRG